MSKIESMLDFWIGADNISPDVYRNDAEAVAVTDMIVSAGQLAELNVPAHILVFHPYHHAEDQHRQERVLDLARQLLTHCEPGWRQSIESNLAYMENHAGVIRRFGRFPHRNRVLARESTPEEIQHLEKDCRTFGQ